jgi:signal transduction histidine kinase
VAGLAELGAGWAMIGAGLHLSRRRPGDRSGYLLAAAGVSWFFADWNNPGIGFPAGFTFGLLTWALAPPVVVHAVLAYRSGGPLRPLDRIALAGAYAGAGLVLGLGPALVFDPRGQGCNQCPANLVLIRGDQAVFGALNRWGVRLGLIWTLALAALAVWRLARSSAPARRMAAIVVLGGAAYLLLVWADFAHSLPRGELSSDPFEYHLWLGEVGALFAIAFGVMWPWLRARRTRSALARLVVELGHSPHAGGLHDALARILGDPGVEVAYPLADPDRYIDALGKPVDPAAWHGRVVTPLSRGGTTVAMLIHRPELLDDPVLVAEVAAAARMALENEQLQAEVRAQIEDLRASRARIVATGDAERRRLERDLHDGAQQRLVGLSLALRLARTKLGPDPEPNLACRIDQAGKQIRAAIDELRELAHGIYPAVLADEGLAAAVETLRERSSIPIRLVAIPEERFPGPVEAAAYFLVAEATGVIAASIGASVVTVAVKHDAGRLLVEVTEDGAGEPTAQVQASLTDLSDRVGALDGHIWSGQIPGRGVTIRAEIPCGS